jgi:tetratricopeptide (TPR) repeat protein
MNSKPKTPQAPPAKTPAAKTVPPAPVPTKVPPLFRRIDWWTMAIAFSIVWVVYYMTLAPQVTLEDSGELTTASYWAGIPHPPGYPFWTIYTWLWTVLVPFKNIAWRVALAEASTASMACGVLAFMVSRGSSMLMEGIEELKGMTGKWEQAICMVCGVTAGLLLGFGSSMWKESVVINRISPFGVPWLMLVLLSMMRWIYAPHQRRYLYTAMFFLGICTTIHQTLILATMGIEIGIAMCDVRLGRDLFALNTICWIGGLIGLATHLLPGLEQTTPMVRGIFNTIGFASAVAAVWLVIKTARVFTEWKSILLMVLLGCCGVSFYFYEPLAGMTCPPMEWGYPRTVGGFIEALTRGQYNKVDPTDIFHNFGRFVTEVGMLIGGVADAYSWVYMFFALLPLFFLFKMQKRERAWVGLVAAIYPFLGVLLSIFLSPTPDRQSSDLVKTFFIASHTLVAIMIGYGLALTAAYMATHYAQFRRWALIVGIVPIVLALYNLKDVAGKHYFGSDGSVSWSDLPHWIGQSFAKDQYGLPIIANLILVAITVAFILGVVLYRQRAPLLITLALFACMPLYSGLSHWFHSQQNDHWFGYWFGHDMFTPPFVGAEGKLTYDPKQRDATAKGPNGLMVYPEMARDAVLFGGTDPGRFCPTYMIFCESFIPHNTQPEQDTNFDRRDVYIITQNALADNVYLDYIRSQFNRSAQIDPPFFQNLLPGFFPTLFHNPTRWLGFLDTIFESIGGKVEFRRRTSTSWFKPDEFTDVKDLASRLRQSDHQDNLSKFLYAKLGKETQTLVDGPGDEPALRRALARDFNAILEGGCLYDEERFKGIKLPPLIVEAMGQNNIPATIIRLNRRMLEEAYPNDIAKSLGGVYPDTEIATPTAGDSQQCINEYYQDVGRRMQHDMQFTNEPRQIRPGEDVRVVEGKIQIMGGQTTVMNINGGLTKIIFDRNPDHEFYVEESFPLDWMYPYLTPFGVIMKINRHPLPEITQDIIDKDHAFWSRYSERTIGDWITYDTSIKEICDWADEVYLRHNFSHFTGDRNFVRDDDGQKAFSKLRSSIGASIYQWRVGNSHSPAEHARVLKEAEFALKQAFAYCPYSPETVSHLMNLLLAANRVEDALMILKTCQNLDPYNGMITDWIHQLERGEQNSIGQYLARIHQAIEARQTNVANQMLEQLLHYPTPDPGIAVNVAAMYLQLGNLPKAEEGFQKLVALVPYSSEAWYNLALVQANRGEVADSVAALKKALTLNPEDRKQHPEIVDLRDHFAKDGGFGRLRQTPEFKAAFPAKP